MLLHSQVLQFSCDGRLLASADATGVLVTEVEGTWSQSRIDQPGVSALAAFPGQVWTLDESRSVLQRFDPEGRSLDGPRALPIAPCAHWTTATTPAPAVVMEGDGRLLIVENGEQLVEKQLPATGVAIPVHGLRHVFCSTDNYVRLGGGVSFRLAAGVTPRCGAAIFEAKSVLLIVTDSFGGYGAVLVDARSGRVTQEFELANAEIGTIRVAARRGLLVIHTSERRLAIVDLLRSGHDPVLVEAPTTIEDFVVDATGRRLAIRAGDAVRLYGLLQLSQSARPELELALGLQPPRRRPLASSPGITPPAPDTGETAASLPLRLLLAPSARGVATTSGVPINSAPGRQPLPLAVGAAPALLPDVRETLLFANQQTDALAASSVRDRTSLPRASASSEPPPPRGTSSTRSNRVLENETRIVTEAGVGQRTSTGVVEQPVKAPVVDLFKLRGFGPPPKHLTVTRHAAARMLDGELRWVELRALLAVGRDWDSGRIAYANESRHPQELEATATLAGNPGGRAREQVEAAHAELSDHERVLTADPLRRTDSTPLGAIAAEFQLSPLAVDILLTIAAPRLRGELSRLYAILANDPKRALVDELLVEQILGSTPQLRTDIAYELGENGALCSYGLVHVDSARPRPHASLSVDPVVIARLRAEPINFGRGAATSIRSADRAVHELLVPPELLLEAMRYLSRTPSDEHQARIAARGKPGSGRRTFLAGLAHKAGRDLGIIDLKKLPRQPDEFATALRVELQRAVLRGSLPCLTRLDDVSSGNDDPVRQLVQDVLRSHQGPAAIHLDPRSRVPLDPGYLLLDLPTPTERQRLQVWSEAVAEHDLSVSGLDALAARYRVGAGTIRSAVRSVAEARVEQGRLAGDVAADIEERMRQTREAKLGEHGRRVERLTDWSALVLPEDTLYSLRELVGRARHRRTVFDQWGFDRVLSTARGLTALFEGPPGTGKTLVAGVIARELGLDLYQVDLSKVMSKWIGETEKNLGAIFDAAEDGQAILLFDEADSLFAKRSEVKSSNDRFANLEVNFLLQRLDSFEGFAILTTNLGTSIDPAFKRRLSFRLTFPSPDHEMRVQLWRVHLPTELPVDGYLDLDALASKYELSGGYIRNACVRAAFLAAEDGARLTQEHLERAVQLEYAEMGKLARSGRME